MFFTTSSSHTLLPACSQLPAAWHWGSARLDGGLWRAVICCQVFQTFLASLGCNFPSLNTAASKVIYLLAWLLRLEARRPCRSLGQRGTQQVPSAHFHPWCFIAAGSGQATHPRLAGTRGTSPLLMKCFRLHSQNNFDVWGEQRNLTRHCAWLAKLLLTVWVKVEGSQSGYCCYCCLFLIWTYCQQTISQISLEDSVCKCCVMLEL